MPYESTAWTQYNAVSSTITIQHFNSNAT